MKIDRGSRFRRLTLAREYMLASLVILIVSMAGLGWWVNKEIQAGVLQETASTTALYMNSFVAPLVQELSDRGALSPNAIARLDHLAKETPLAKQVISLKIWTSDGRVAYSVHGEIIGKIFPMSRNAERAWRGVVTAVVSDLEEEENVVERRFGTRLIETYSPIHRQDGEDIIAVAEFYQSMDHLEGQLLSARVNTWLIVGLATLAIYGILAGIVRRGSNIIARQQHDLSDKVGQLTALLTQNEQLSRRVQRAATSSAERNERYLRRLSAELHDGPAQELGLAVLKLDSVIAHSEACAGETQGRCALGEDLYTIQNCLGDALTEIRSLSSGLAVPDLEGLTVSETVERVSESHERRTGTRVALNIGKVPDKVELPVKITLYRLIQEALNNAYRHADAAQQKVKVRHRSERLLVEISDRGPGIQYVRDGTAGESLGIAGMRERVESLGGSFEIQGLAGTGTRVSALLPLNNGRADHG